MLAAVDRVQIRVVVRNHSRGVARSLKGLPGRAARDEVAERRRVEMPFRAVAALGMRRT